MIDRVGLSNLRAKLSDQQIGLEVLKNPAIGDAISESARMLAEKADASLGQFDCDWYLEDLKRGLCSFRWLYPLVLKQVPVEKFKRVEPALSGPLYTSAEFPWPEVSGLLREPVAQFYLQDVGAMIGTDLGEGLLQLWVGPGHADHLIRTIPTNLVDPSLVTPVPQRISNEYFSSSHQQQRFSVGASGTWPKEDANGLRRVWLIDGVGPKIMSWSKCLTADNDDPELEDLLESVEFEEYRDFIDLLPSNSLATDESDHHFFGNFDPIQYSVEEMPPTLLALESADPFYWGDHGNAQIFYEISRDSRPSFRFRWSCH